MIRGFAFPIATPETNDASMLALRGPDISANFALLAQEGYKATELMVRDPRLLDAASIASAAANAGIAIAAVSTGQIWKEDKLTLADAVGFDRLQAVIAFAARFGACVNIGTFRGEDPASARDALLRLVAASPVTINVEPQCRWVGRWLHTVDETLAWLPDERLMINFDAYHALLEEDSICSALLRARPRLGWVQIADSNRRAPGQGQLNIGEILRVLAATGYTGLVCVECWPIPDARAAAQAAARHLHSLLP